MKDIMLVCSAGMSTSLLVVKMNEAAKAQNIDVNIFAVSEMDASNHYDKISVLLLGPQVRYLKAKLTKTLAPKSIPVEVINSMHYGTLNGEAVLKAALDLIKE
ncbi:PTS sugar transporter subunit IIB [Acidaminobacter sp. JC074]|uniref:PTS sugar transporter subunit IIB n=1 Tax=Acidaminobacter sp. JC074 TaxID=2530199 RepID=UPI001F0DB6C5|nr:PTS sugar transporter subunit IIB [Acidaminobacter sp. JC074]MCH4887241.1 PTS sugar transporter subunit IIB [Acidaminobacter sp. JC074]